MGTAESLHNNSNDIHVRNLTSLETIHQRKILPLPTLRRKTPTTTPLPLPQTLSSPEFTFKSSYPSTPASALSIQTTGSILSSHLTPYQGHGNDLYDQRKAIRHDDTYKKGPSTNDELTSSSLPSPTAIQPCKYIIQQWLPNTIHVPASSEHKEAKSHKSSEQRSSLSSPAASSERKKPTPRNKIKNRKTLANHHGDRGINRKKQGNTSQPFSRKSNIRRLNDGDNLDLVALDRNDRICLFC